MSTCGSLTHALGPEIFGPLTHWLQLLIAACGAGQATGGLMASPVSVDGAADAELVDDVNPSSADVEARRAASSSAGGDDVIDKAQGGRDRAKTLDDVVITKADVSIAVEEDDESDYGSSDESESDSDDDSDNDLAGLFDAALTSNHDDGDKERYSAASFQSVLSDSGSEPAVEFRTAASSVVAVVAAPAVAAAVAADAAAVTADGGNPSRRVSDTVTCSAAVEPSPASAWIANDEDVVVKPSVSSQVENGAATTLSSAAGSSADGDNDDDDSNPGRRTSPAVTAAVTDDSATAAAGCRLPPSRPASVASSSKSADSGTSAGGSASSPPPSVTDDNAHDNDASSDGVVAAQPPPPPVPVNVLKHRVITVAPAPREHRQGMDSVSNGTPSPDAVPAAVSDAVPTVADGGSVAGPAVVVAAAARDDASGVLRPTPLSPSSAGAVAVDGAAAPAGGSVSAGVVSPTAGSDGEPAAVAVPPSAGGTGLLFVDTAAESQVRVVAATMPCVCACSGGCSRGAACRRAFLPRAVRKWIRGFWTDAWSCVTDVRVMCYG